jgi:hypothetical protein
VNKFLGSLCLLVVLSSTLLAGPAEVSSSGKEVQQTAIQQTETWYRDREWNVDLFGAYAFTANSYRFDRYLDADHAWGGGLDVNYFFMRYLGVGLEGYALAAENTIGQASGNLIFRYPFPDSRFAPYAFAGGGVILNGSKTEDLVERGRNLGTITNNSNAKGIGQFGGGIEVRVTPHIGIMNDFSWNVINGSNNNFGMVRTGIRFAF